MILFRVAYNEERPHEGIAMQRPARLYRKVAARPFPSTVREPEYAGHFETRRVASNGMISWRDHKIFVGDALAGRRIGLEPTADGIWTLHFYRFVIGKIDERRNCFL